MLSTVGHHQGDDDQVSKMFGFYFSHVYSSMPLNVFVFFPVINFKRNYFLSEISTFFLSFNFNQRML